MVRTGIYGGSFNPVHNGHMHLAETAVRELSLDRLYFVPSRISPHRSSDEYASAEDRLEMLRLACEGSSMRGRLCVSDYEIRSQRISYTVYTVTEFRRLLPPPDNELYLLIGSDMLLSFDTWREYRKIMSMVTLAVVSRTDGDISELERKAEGLREYGDIVISQAAPVEVSSSEIRKKIAQGEDISCCVDENVVKYIEMHGLYGNGGEGGALQY